MKPHSDQITETPEQATQAENSPDTLIILTVSLIGASIVGVGLLWYFGYVFTG